MTGEKVFAAAKAALERWQQFRLGWVEASPEDTPIKEGQVVAILARSIGLWWLNACRIVDVVDEDGPVQRFGFAYGTLPDHAGSGEERFLVEWDRARRQRVVRHPGLLPASPFPGPARLSVGAPSPEAIRSGVGRRDVPGGASACRGCFLNSWNAGQALVRDWQTLCVHPVTPSPVATRPAAS